jgi:hypothetical protein
MLIYPLVIHSLVISFGQLSKLIFIDKQLINNEIIELFNEWTVTNNYSKLDI